MADSAMSQNNKIAIGRVDAREPSFDFAALQREERPVIITGAVEQWPARSKWSLQYLAEQLGEREYTAEVGLPKEVPINFNLTDFQKTISLKEFVDIALNSSSEQASYITNKSIDRFPGLEDDVRFAEVVGQSVSPELTRLWIGTANTKSSLHFDYYENVLCQIVGSKRVYLVDPVHTAHLYQYSSNIDKSQVDVEKPDFVAFPKFKNADVYEGELQAGDILLIPKVWWHSVRSLEPSISVNCFYGERLGERELLPVMFAGGPRLIGAFIRDFFWNGMLARPYVQRLYTAEPFGVWFYYQLRNSIRRRMGWASADS